jgi:hypothetical protein
VNRFTIHQNSFLRYYTVAAVAVRADEFYRGLAQVLCRRQLLLSIG